MLSKGRMAGLIEGRPARHSEHKALRPQSFLLYLFEKPADCHERALPGSLQPWHLNNYLITSWTSLQPSTCRRSSNLQHTHPRLMMPSIVTSHAFRNAHKTSSPPTSKGVQQYVSSLSDPRDEALGMGETLSKSSSKTWHLTCSKTESSRLHARGIVSGGNA